MTTRVLIVLAVSAVVFLLLLFFVSRPNLPGAGPGHGHSALDDPAEKVTAGESGVDREPAPGSLRGDSQVSDGAQVEPRQDRSRRLRVVDEEREPLEGASVQVRGGAVAETNGNGEVDCAELGSGTAIVLRHGYLPRLIEVGDSAADREVLLARASKPRCVVRTEEGAAVPGAQVELVDHSWPWNAVADRLGRRWTADAAGAFLLPAAFRRSGAYRFGEPVFRVGALEGAVFLSTLDSTYSGESDYVLSIGGKPRSVILRFVDADANPLPDLGVSVFHEGAPLATSLVTDSRGEVEFRIAVPQDERDWTHLEVRADLGGDRHWLEQLFLLVEATPWEYELAARFDAVSVHVSGSDEGVSVASASWSDAKGSWFPGVDELPWQSVPAGGELSLASGYRGSASVVLLRDDASSVIVDSAPLAQVVRLSARPRSRVRVEVERQGGDGTPVTLLVAEAEGPDHTLLETWTQHRLVDGSFDLELPYGDYLFGWGWGRMAAPFVDAGAIRIRTPTSTVRLALPCFRTVAGEFVGRRSGDIWFHPGFETWRQPACPIDASGAFEALLSCDEGPRHFYVFESSAQRQDETVVADTWSREWARPFVLWEETEDSLRIECQGGILEILNERSWKSSTGRLSLIDPTGGRHVVRQGPYDLPPGEYRLVEPHKEVTFLACHEALERSVTIVAGQRTTVVVEDVPLAVLELWVDGQELTSARGIARIEAPDMGESREYDWRLEEYQLSTAIRVVLPPGAYVLTIEGEAWYGGEGPRAFSMTRDVPALQGVLRREHISLTAQ